MNLVDLYRKDIQPKMEIMNLINQIEKDVQERLQPFIGRANTVEVTKEVEKIVNKTCEWEYVTEVPIPPEYITFYKNEG